jgi:hypothetical protein
MKKFLISSVKLIYMLMCYNISILLSIVSAGFTLQFYTDGHQDLRMLSIGAMAILFELSKIVLAFSYPYMTVVKYKKQIGLYLNICLFLSILASLSFLMQENLETSPATKIIDLLVRNFPFLGIIQGFTSFMANISLSIIIETLIIKLPSFATIFNDSCKSRVENSQPLNIYQMMKALIYKFTLSRVEEIYNKNLNPQPSNIGNSQPLEGKKEQKIIRVEENVKTLDVTTLGRVDEGLREVEKSPIKRVSNNTGVENSQPSNIGNSQPSTLKVEKILNPQPSILNPQPLTLRVENSSTFIKWLIENAIDKDGYCIFTNQELTKKCNISDWQLRNFKKQLKENGLIEIIKNKIMLKGENRNVI